jgi:drug/metabolite transporter (DMT)-like permease
VGSIRRVGGRDRYVGSTFIVTKDATEQMSVLGFLTWRFGTGLMVVLTPVVASLLFGERVTRPAWGGVALATLGMAVLSLDRFSVSAGAFLTLLGAVLFAFHIASLGAWATRQDALALTAVHVAIATTICGLSR